MPWSVAGQRHRLRDQALGVRAPARRARRPRRRRRAPAAAWSDRVQPAGRTPPGGTSRSGRSSCRPAGVAGRIGSRLIADAGHRCHSSRPTTLWGTVAQPRACELYGRRRLQRTSSPGLCHPPVAGRGRQTSFRTGCSSHPTVRLRGAAPGDGRLPFTYCSAVKPEVRRIHAACVPRTRRPVTQPPVRRRCSSRPSLLLASGAGRLLARAPARRRARRVPGRLASRRPRRGRLATPDGAALAGGRRHQRDQELSGDLATSRRS